MKQSIYAQLNDGRWLTDQIVGRKKNCAQIARELGIANRSAVNRAVKKLGLSDKVYRSRYPQLSDKKWLERQLLTKTLVEIAKEVGTTPGNVGDRVRRYGLQPGGKSEAVKAGLLKKYPDGRFGSKSSNWRGGRRMVQGYILVHNPNHPYASQGSVFEHRLVAEKTLGRYLTKDEVVHHINGDKSDNRPENLEVCKRSEHVHHHFTAGKGIQTLHKRIQYLENLLKDNNIEFL